MSILKRTLAAALVLMCAFGGALAEKGVYDPYPGVSWNASLVDVLMQPNELAVVVNDTDESGVVRNVVTTEGALIGAYEAEYAMMEFCDDVLSGVYFKISDDCSSFAFENLDAAIRRNFGEPICLDPELMPVESYGSYFKRQKEFVDEAGFYTVYAAMNGYQGLNNGSEVTSYRVWEIDDGVLLALGYYEPGVFILRDYIGVTLLRVQ